MKKGIIIDDQLERRKMLALNFEMYVDVSFLGVANADEAMKLLKKDPKIDLIICKNNIKDENTILKTFYYVNSNKLDIPIVCLGACVKLGSEENVHIVEEMGGDMRPMVRWVAKKLKVTAEMMALKETQEYYPIAIRHFNLLKNIPCAVYRKDSEGQYHLFLASGAEITNKSLKQYLMDGVKEVYVGKFERLKFVNDLTEQSLIIIRKKNADTGDRVNATGNTFDESKKLLSEIGLNEKSIKLARETIDSILTIVQATDNLAELLAILENSCGSYLYKHSVLCATLGHHCLANLRWGTNSQKETLCFIAYFHDITLDRDELAKINNLKDFEAAGLSQEDAKLVEQHAFRASQLVQDYPQVPFGAAEAILQHHGMGNGIGFSSDLKSNIGPIACVFQVVEAFVDKLLSSSLEQKIDRDAEIDKLAVKFNKGHYKDAIEGLRSIKI